MFMLHSFVIREKKSSRPPGYALFEQFWTIWVVAVILVGNNYHSVLVTQYTIAPIK